MNEDYDLSRTSSYTMTVFNLSDESLTHGDGWRSGVECQASPQGFESAAENYARDTELAPGSYTLAVQTGNEMKLVYLTVEPPVEPKISVQRILVI